MKGRFDERCPNIETVLIGGYSVRKMSIRLEIATKEETYYVGRSE